MEKFKLRGHLLSPLSKVTAPFGYTVFCDDIRDELGGKETLVGVYNQVLYLSTPFPTVVPKLCLSIFYCEPFEGHPDKAELLIFLPTDPADKPSMRAQLDYAGARSNNTVAHFDMKEEPEVLMFNTRVVLSPLAVNEESDIRVRMDRGDRTIKIGRLLIRKAPDTNPSS